MAAVIDQYITDGRYAVGRLVRVMQSGHAMGPAQIHLLGRCGRIQDVVTWEQNGNRPSVLRVGMFGCADVHEIPIIYLQPMNMVVVPNPDRDAGRLVRQTDLPLIWGKILANYRSSRSVRVCWFDPSMTGTVGNWPYDEVEQIEFTYLPF